MSPISLQWLSPIRQEGTKARSVANKSSPRPTDRPYPLSVSQGPALFPSSFFPFSHPLFRPLGKCIQHTHTCGVRASETRANAVSPHRASEGKTRKLCERHFESVWSSRGREGATDRSERLLPGGGRLFCRGHGWRGIRK